MEGWGLCGGGGCFEPSQLKVKSLLRRASSCRRRPTLGRNRERSSSGTQSCDRLLHPDHQCAEHWRTESGRPSPDPSAKTWHASLFRCSTMTSFKSLRSQKNTLIVEERDGVPVCDWGCRWRKYPWSWRCAPPSGERETCVTLKQTSF